MKTNWTFIAKDKFRKKDRIGSYGSLTAIYNTEKPAVKKLGVTSLQSFRRLVKEKYVDSNFHIEKLTVKRSKQNVR